MKFLCVPCDEPMKLARTLGPDEGSLSIVYVCPVCRRETAMLTNAMETQMVRALDVKIGGRTLPREPMSFVRDTLTGVDATAAGGSVAQASPEATAPASTGKCPFSHVANEAFEKSPPSPAAPVWTDAAAARIERVPEYIRPMVKKGVEEYARAEGLSEIDVSVMDDLKGRFGM